MIYDKLLVKKKYKNYNLNEEKQDPWRIEGKKKSIAVNEVKEPTQYSMKFIYSKIQKLTGKINLASKHYPVKIIWVFYNPIYNFGYSSA